MKEQAVKERPTVTLCCNFCGASSRERKHLIAGPMVYICDECVDLCTEIVAEERAKPWHDLRNAP